MPPPFFSHPSLPFPFPRCVKESGDAKACQKYKKWFNSICPMEWVSAGERGVGGS